MTRGPYQLVALEMPITRDDSSPLESSFSGHVYYVLCDSSDKLISLYVLSLCLKILYNNMPLLCVSVDSLRTATHVVNDGRVIHVIAM